MSDAPDHPSTQAALEPHVTPRTGLATAALICGVLGMCTPFLGIAAVVLGTGQLARIRRAPDVYGGRGLSIAGICTGCVGLLITLGIVLSILYPSLNPLTRANEMSLRLVCASNLKGFGTAMRIYAYNHGGQYPPDLQYLLDSGDFVPKQFVCPSSGNGPSDPIDASYVYIPGQGEGFDARNVVAYEREENHAGEGGNVLFADGHVEFISPYSEVEKLVQETKSRLERQRPGQQRSP